MIISLPRPFLYVFTIFMLNPENLMYKYWSLIFFITAISISIFTVFYHWRKSISQKKYYLKKQIIQNVADNITNICFALNKQLKFIYFNKSSETFFGIKAKEILGNSWFNLNSTLDHQQFANAYRTCLSTGEFSHFEISSKNNQQITIFRINIYPSNLGVLVAFKNITKEKETEQKIQAYWAKYKLLFDQSNSYNVYLDKNKNIIRSNAGFKNFLTDLNIIPGTYPANIAKMQYYSQFLDDFNCCIKNRRIIQHETKITIARKEKWFDNKYIPVINDKNELLGIQIIINDITTHKENLKKIEDAHRLYSSLVENINLGLVIIQNGKRVYYNRASYEMLGYLKEEYDKLTFKDILHPDDYEAYQKEIINKINYKAESSPVSKIRFLSKNNQYKWFESSSEIIDWNSQPAIEFFLYDITEQVTLRKYLEKLSCNLKTVIENTNNIIFSLNSKYEIITFNTDAKNTFKEKLNIILENGTNILELLPDELKNTWKERYDKALKGKVIDAVDYFQHNENEYYYEVKISPIKEAFGITGVVIYSSDITLKKQNEAQLKINEERFRLVVDTARDGIWDWNDLSNNKVFWSSRLYEILGYYPNEIESKIDNWFDHVHPNDRERIKSRIENHLHFESPEKTEYQIRKKNGQYIWLSSRSNTIKDCTGKVIRVIGAVTDITEQKETDKLVKTAMIEAEEKVRTNFAREIHDGIGPLLSSLHMYLDWYTKTDDPVKRELIITNGTELINEAISTIEYLSNNLSPKTLNTFGIKAAIETFINRINISSRSKLMFVMNFDNRINPNLEINIYRIITELINNSLKHAKASVIKINIKFNHSQNRLLILFSDDGIGFNYKEALKRNKGFGLINLNERVKLFDGDIHFHTQLGKGLLVKIKFDDICFLG